MSKINKYMGHTVQTDQNSQIGTMIAEHLKKPEDDINSRLGKIKKHFGPGKGGWSLALEGNQQLDELPVKELETHNETIVEKIGDINDHLIPVEG
ncbi:hypothetical protein phytr_1600 [Candidatus Phycorickettsia trachydisci]|uniref:Uncharacterized protein n=1 Tax=Candidatus Phycorickettsia trachydisci TaxID=2115978 RepID=A0A2P1P770_9RICK|nr:hypothetical protein [Candidatus Phycorickettsia trachydisci]AVP87119.1 hypothetical protein phytr_1600 [Candidatus Phycorickettsia trachydisci]